MRNLVKLIAVAAIAVLPLLSGSSAGAQQATCEIGFTGPNSNNQCVSTTTYECEVTNTNTVVIRNESNQEVASGQVSVGGNTTGGTATSGTVTNTNGTTFSVTITNSAPESEEPGICTATVVVPATETPEEPEPVVPAGGGGAAAGSGGGGQVAVLPATSADQMLATAALIATLTLAAAGASVGGVLWYRHHKAL